MEDLANIPREDQDGEDPVATGDPGEDSGCLELEHEQG